MPTTSHMNPIKRAKAKLREMRKALVTPPKIPASVLGGGIEGVPFRIPAEELARWDKDMQRAKRPIHVSEVIAPTTTGRAYNEPSDTAS